MKKTLCLFLFIYAVVWQSVAQSNRPNIIYIMADDLGYGNLTCYNPTSKVPTPNLDKMAKEGTRFTRFYAGSTVCAPSRCALMTGKHMGHAYVRGNGEIPLRSSDIILPELLKANGYATGMFGKWGLGTEENEGAPQKKGWDEFFGYLNQRHAHHYFTDHVWEVKNKKLSKVPLDTTQYTHDLIMDKALNFVRNHKNEPFFLYLPITLVHAELLIPAAYQQPFLNADGSSKLPPETPFYQKKATYHTQLQPHAAFAAMVNKMDQDVGRVLSLLKELGIDNNTYVFFTSDNGPHKEGGGDPEFFNSAGEFRGIKRDFYEGGIRVPMIVRFPQKVPAGKVNDVALASWDILPTITELTGTKNTLPAIDGISMKSALLGQKQQQHDHLYWAFNEGQLRECVMQGDWKLLRFKNRGKAEILELYNIITDPKELHNVASAHAGLVKKLYGIMKSAQSPAENPAFDWRKDEE